MIKKKCQVFTPKKIVIELLNQVEYKKNLYGKKVLENSCGEGHILLEVVRRYIRDCLKNNMKLEDIKNGLENDIYGIEYYRATYEKCLKNLNDFVKKYDILNVNWNLFCGDSLKIELNIKFDFIIGNPPYLTHGDLVEDEREYLKKKFESCKYGKFDYCYAFIENALNDLSIDGKLAYLIPNSIFKTVFGKKLRELMVEDLKKIINYTTQKLFSALTSSAIIICEKYSRKNYIEYVDIVNQSRFKIKKRNLGNKWIFEEEVVEYGEKRFGDYFKVSNTPATLYNKAYIISGSSNEEELENEVLRIASSPRNIALGREEMIIFPYYYNDEGKLCKYSEEEFENRFPNAFAHLKKYSCELSLRKAEKNIKWFEYGRGQALSHLNCQKLLISTIITQKVHVYELDAWNIPYTGLYITTIGELSLQEAKRLLESNQFFEYVNRIGVNASGISKRITSKDVENFIF